MAQPPSPPFDLDRQAERDLFLDLLAALAGCTAAAEGFACWLLDRLEARP